MRRAMSFARFHRLPKVRSGAVFLATDQPTNACKDQQTRIEQKKHREVRKENVVNWVDEKCDGRAALTPWSFETSLAGKLGDKKYPMKAGIKEWHNAKPTQHAGQHVPNCKGGKKRRAQSEGGERGI
jgi:outer membrane PBP1 activator LpoA protein